MKIKKGFELREICGEYLIIAHGRENIDFTRVITLNESAADIWNAVIGKSFTVKDMKNAFTELYDVDDNTAMKDSEKLLSQWIDAGLVDE